MTGKEKRGPEARKKELERQMKLLLAEIDQTTESAARLKLLIRLKKLEDEYSTFYND